jgi:hypothetical protein
VVAGARQQQGWKDGFGAAARFNHPEGIALLGESYGWPCLYINEDSGGQVSSLREVRLRDQYVRSIQLVGLRDGYDIETIIPYTDHFSGEVGLLLAGGDIYFAPLAQLPTESRTWSTPISRFLFSLCLPTKGKDTKSIGQVLSSHQYIHSFIVFS